jgi:hypothetical protein
MLRFRMALGRVVLLAVALAATTGCNQHVEENQAAFDEFASQEAELRCEIDVICGLNETWDAPYVECREPQSFTFDRCDSFRDDYAAQCLADLSRSLAAVSDASSDAELASVCLLANADAAGICPYVADDSEPSGVGACSTP